MRYREKEERWRMWAEKERAFTSLGWFLRTVSAQQDPGG